MMLPVTWTLFLGAGASVAAPTRLPTFLQMRDSILAAMGWAATEPGDPAAFRLQHADGLDVREFPPLSRSRLSRQGIPPELLFGTLHRFHVPFARQVQDLMAPPCRLLPHNAVHAVAAQVLHTGGTVWTPNIDVAVENAYGALCGHPAHRVCTGTVRPDGSRERPDYRSAAPGSLIKFHGSADLPGSLAFTDLELLAPLDEPDERHLASLAAGTDLVLYGWAGADLDLRGVVQSAMQAARTVTWIEPATASHEGLRQAFPAPGLRLRPEDPDGQGWRLPEAVDSLLALADAAGLTSQLTPAERSRLHEPGLPPKPELHLPQLPAIVHARMVERFGRAADETTALRLARRADLPRMRPREPRLHARWALSRSLYGGGVVGRLVRSAALHPDLLAPLPYRAVRYVYDKGPAVLLGIPDSVPAIERLAEQSLVRRPPAERLATASDLYYLGHARRNQLRVDDGQALLDRAGWLMVDPSGRTDTERLAGVILESGILALYRGDFAAALRHAADLSDVRGRYAIGRWPAWGQWLAGFGHLYASQDVRQAHGAFERADEAFEVADYDNGRVDVWVGRLLAARVALAVHGDTPRLPPQPAGASPRQRQDAALVRADLAVAVDDLEQASALLQEVLARPAIPVQRAWAQLGLAEVRRLSGQQPAGLVELETSARRAGALWLATQTRLARLRAGERLGASEPTVTPPRHGVGRPVLWLVS